MKKMLIAAATTLALFTAPFASADGEAVYQSCVECHGKKAELPALNQSDVIKGWPVDKTVAALKGYRDGSYGGPMKGLMKAKLEPLSDADIQAVAEYIAGL